MASAGGGGDKGPGVYEALELQAHSAFLQFPVQVLHSEAGHGSVSGRLAFGLRQHLTHPRSLGWVLAAPSHPLWVLRLLLAGPPTPATLFLVSAAKWGTHVEAVVTPVVEGLDVMSLVWSQASLIPRVGWDPRYKPLLSLPPSVAVMPWGPGAVVACARC